MSEKPVVAAAETEDLPKTIVRRLVKDKLSQLSKDSEIQVLRDSLRAFCESSRIFIHYLSATANDICRESKRQTINAEDVFKALEEIEFPEFVEPLRDSLEEFRQKNAQKRSASSKPKEAKKSPVENGGEEQEIGVKDKEENARKRSASSKPKEAKRSKAKKGPVENGGEEQENGEKDEEDNARKRSASSKPKEAKKSKTKKGLVENGSEEQEDGEKDNDNQ